MHVVGARFADLGSANAALGEIRARVGIAGGDVAVRPLGSTRYDEPVAAFLLAGRFPAAEVDRVIGIVEQHGGTVLSRSIEWPHPSLTGTGGGTGTGATSAPGSSRDGRGYAPDRQGAQAPRFGVSPSLRQGGHVRLRRPAALMHVRAARVRGFSV